MSVDSFGGSKGSLHQHEAGGDCDLMQLLLLAACVDLHYSIPLPASSLLPCHLRSSGRLQLSHFLLAVLLRLTAVY